MGPDWAEGLKKANAELPHLVSQMRSPLSWLNNQLNDGRKYLCGEAQAAIDAQFYHIVWFLRGRWAQGAALLSEFSNVEKWENPLPLLAMANPASCRLSKQSK